MNNSNDILSFPYPENRDKTISNQMLYTILVGFLVYVAFKQDAMILLLAPLIIIFKIFTDLKTFFLVDHIIITDRDLILKKNDRIHSKTPLENLMFKVTTNPMDYSNKILLDFYEIGKNKHLVTINNKDIPENMYEQFIQVLSHTSSRSTKDFKESSHNQLLSLFVDNMNETTMQGEFIKLSLDALYDRYSILLFIGLILLITITLYLVNE